MDSLEKIEEEIHLLQQDYERLRELLRRAKERLDFGNVEDQLFDDITEALGP